MKRSSPYPGTFSKVRTWFPDFRIDASPSSELEAERSGGAAAVDRLSRLRRQFPLMGSNWLGNSSPQGEEDRAAGRRGLAEGPLTPSPGLARSSPLGEQLGQAYPAVQTSMISPKPRMSPVVVGAIRFMA